MGKAEKNMDESRRDDLELTQNAGDGSPYTAENVDRETEHLQQDDQTSENIESFQPEPEREQIADELEPMLPLGDEPPAYESLSPEEMADEIARAVAHSVEPPEGAHALEQSVNTEQAVAAEDWTEPSATPDEVSQQAPLQSDATAPQRQESARAEAPKAEKRLPQQATQESVYQSTAEEKTVKRGNANRKNATAAPKSPGVSQPGTTHKRIPRSHISVAATGYFADMLTDVRRRQDQALPKNGTSLRGTEKRLAQVTGINRILAPIRFVIFILMLLCIGGRSIAWMTLGFMTGMQAVYISVAAVLLSMLLCWKNLLNGLRDFWYLRASYESFLLVATALTVVEALAYKNETTLLPMLVIAWCMSGSAGLMHDQANLRSLRSVITGRDRIGIRTSPNQWDHIDVIGKAPVTTAGFVRHQAASDPWHNGMMVFLPILSLVCLVLSAYISARMQAAYLTVLVTLLVLATPIGFSMSCARPYSLLSQALRGRGAVAGWFGIKQLYGKKAMLIYDSDLFPKGTMQQQGIRTCGPMSPRELVSCGASMALRTNVGFRSMFAQLLRDLNGEIYEVSRLQVHETGLEGYIRGNLMHLGSYQYMQLMGVTLPPKAPRYAVYLAVNRELYGVFGVKYQVSAGSKRGLRRMVREPRLTPLLVTRNFCVNPGFVSRWFKTPVTQIACPKSDTRRRLSEPSLLRKGVTCGFALREGVNSYSRIVVGARRVYRMGFWMTAAAVLLSTVLMIQTAAALLSGTQMLSLGRLLLMHFLCWLATEIWARAALRK